MPATYSLRTYLERAMRTPRIEPLLLKIQLIGQDPHVGDPFRLLSLHSDFMIVDREKWPEKLVRYDAIATVTIIQ